MNRSTTYATGSARRVVPVLVFAASLCVPSPGRAQINDYAVASLGIGLSAGSHAAHGTHIGVGLGFGIGLGFSFHRDPYRYGGVYESVWHRPQPCWGAFWLDPFFWHDPFVSCAPYYGVGYPAYGHWGWGAPPWAWYGPRQLGFLGWPSHRYVRSRWWSPTYWVDHRAPYWADRYADPHTRVVSRSPLFGPRYKEYPGPPPVYVTDNGPERPVSKAMPRSGSAGVVADGTRRGGYLDRNGARSTEGTRSARPRSGTGDRAARPRTATSVGTAAPRSTPPRVRARPQPSARRPSPIARATPSSRRPSPTVRSAPTRRSAPTARSAPSRNPPPKARSAPSRAPKPSVRSAPRGSGSRKAPPRRPARRPGG